MIFYAVKRMPSNLFCIKTIISLLQIIIGYLIATINSLNLTIVYFVGLQSSSELFSVFCASKDYIKANKGLICLSTSMVLIR